MLSSVFSCLETLMKHSPSFMKYYFKCRVAYNKPEVTRGTGYINRILLKSAKHPVLVIIQLITSTFRHRFNLIRSPLLGVSISHTNPWSQSTLFRIYLFLELISCGFSRECLRLCTSYCIPIYCCYASVVISKITMARSVEKNLRSMLCTTGTMFSRETCF